jgi:hypothetical protein
MKKITIYLYRCELTLRLTAFSIFYFHSSSSSLLMQQTRQRGTSNLAICYGVESGPCCPGPITGNTAFYLKLQMLWPWLWCHLLTFWIKNLRTCVDARNHSLVSVLPILATCWTLSKFRLYIALITNKSAGIFHVIYIFQIFSWLIN